ncbi:MAG: DNA translocase FtsK 4TM domain-containing protein, partial [Sphingomonadaceae bacterium]|nr:DNA translocase FtsK 4TM domain-containing protein [Sphingomonadaceae bacterium]
MASRVSKITSKTNMANWRQMMRASLIRSGALIGAATLGMFAIFYGLSVLSYSPADAAFNSSAAGVQHNWMGQSGAYMGDAALFLFGLPAIFLLPLMLVFARRLWRDVPQPEWKRQLVQCVFGMLLMGFGMAYWQHGSDIGLPAGWGGTIALLADSGITPLLSRIDGGLGTLVRVTLIFASLLGGIALVVRSLQLERPLFRVSAIPFPKSPRWAADDLGAIGDDSTPPVEAKPPRKVIEPENRKPPVIDDRNAAPKKAAFSTG